MFKVPSVFLSFDITPKNTEREYIRSPAHTMVPAVDGQHPALGNNGRPLFIGFYKGIIISRVS